MPGHHVGKDKLRHVIGKPPPQFSIMTISSTVLDLNCGPVPGNSNKIVNLT